MGVVEKDNARSIFKLSGKQFAILYASLFHYEEIHKLLNAIDMSSDGINKIKAKSLAAKAVERFVLATSTQEDKKTNDLGFSVIDIRVFRIYPEPGKLMHLLNGSVK